MPLCVRGINGLTMPKRCDAARKDETMTLDELKQQISTRTGVPVELLTATTPEASIEQAREILALKGQQPKSTGEQFAAWLTGESSDDGLAALDQLFGGYPAVPDGGNPIIPRDTPKTRDQFGEWFNHWSDFSGGF